MCHVASDTPVTMKSRAVEPVDKVKKLSVQVLCMGGIWVVHLNLQFIPYYTALKFNLNVFDFHNNTNKMHFVVFERKLETMFYVLCSLGFSLFQKLVDLALKQSFRGYYMIWI